jgi:hypothetical protein
MKNGEAAANVINLDAFRQKKMIEARMPDGQAAASSSISSSYSLVVPVWFCWVPMWTPFVG